MSCPDKARSKLDNKSVTLMFIGYAKNSRGLNFIALRMEKLLLVEMSNLMKALGSGMFLKMKIIIALLCMMSLWLHINLIAKILMLLHHKPFLVLLKEIKLL